MTDSKEAISTAATTLPRDKSTRRAMLGLGLGNTLENYDWLIFGFLAAYIGPQFFAKQDPVSSTLDALAIFAVGFVARPLGGVVLGNVADRLGRRRVMLWSVGIMTLTTLVLGLLPTYSAIGNWASIILLVIRILQGLSLGIEAPLSTAYAVELNPKGYEGRASGYMGFFVNLGILLASLTTFVASYGLGADAMSDWGWRIPILVGAAMGFVVFFLRRALPESLGSHEAGDSNAGVWSGVGRHWLGLVAMIAIIGAVQAFIYAWNVGLPNLARGTFNEDPSAVFALTTALGVISLIGSIIVGRWADRVRLSRAFVIGRLAAVPTVFLMLLYARPNLATFAVVLLLGGVVLTVNATLFNVVATSLMPKYCRATGVGLGYGIAVAACGGTASYLLVWLDKSGVRWLFPTYVAVLSLLSVALYFLARRYSGTFAGE